MRFKKIPAVGTIALTFRPISMVQEIATVDGTLRSNVFQRMLFRHARLNHHRCQQQRASMKRLIAMHEDCFLLAASRLTCAPQSLHTIRARLALVIHGCMDHPQLDGISGFTMSSGHPNSVDMQTRLLHDPRIHQETRELFPINTHLVITCLA